MRTNLVILLASHQFKLLFALRFWSTIQNAESLVFRKVHCESAVEFNRAKSRTTGQYILIGGTCSAQRFLGVLEFHDHLSPWVLMVLLSGGPAGCCIGFGHVACLINHYNKTFSDFSLIWLVCFADSRNISKFYGVQTDSATVWSVRGFLKSRSQRGCHHSLHPARTNLKWTWLGCPQVNSHNSDYLFCSLTGKTL